MPRSFVALARDFPASAITIATCSGLMGLFRGATGRSSFQTYWGPSEHLGNLLVRNLEVSGTNSYIVAAEVLAHNASTKDLRLIPMWPSDRTVPNLWNAAVLLPLDHNVYLTASEKTSELGGTIRIGNELFTVSGLIFNNEFFSIVTFESHDKKPRV